MRLRSRASKADGTVGWPAIPVEAARVQAPLSGPYAGALGRFARAAAVEALADAARCLLDGAEAAVL